MKDGFLGVQIGQLLMGPLDYNRYFVTELLGTDLHRLLTSRPLEKQFIQYFLYQILVRSPTHDPHSAKHLSNSCGMRFEKRPTDTCKARIEIRSLSWSGSSGSETK